MKRPVFLAGALLAAFTAATAGAQSLRVDLDSRLELAGAVEWLASSASTSAPDRLASSAYVRDLTGRFSKPAAAELLAPRPQWTSADRARLMLSLSPLPKLERNDAVELSDVERAGGREALELWLAALRDFARASDFNAAFNASRYLLDPDAERLRKRLAAADPLKAFSAYTRLNRSGPTLLLLSPFQASGPAPGYAKVLEDGRVALTVVIGPAAASTAAASGLDYWSDRLPEALWNELAQAELGPLAALYADRIGQSSGLGARADWNCPRDWTRCVQDEIARAVTLRLVARRDGAAAAKAHRAGLEGDARNPMLTALLEGLERYEKSRPRGAGLADSYAELLSVLPLDDPRATPAPPRLPPLSSVSPEQRRRLASFLSGIAPASRNPRLKALAAGAGAWSRGTSAPPAAVAGAAPLTGAAELRQRGIDDFSAGRLQAALDDFQAALSTAPRDAQTLASEAAVLAALGRDDEALAAYSSAEASARADADSSSLLLAADILSSRATILERRGRAAEAIDDLEDALRTAPSDWPRRKDARRRLKSLRASAPKRP